MVLNWAKNDSGNTLVSSKPSLPVLPSLGNVRDGIGGVSDLLLCSTWQHQQHHHSVALPCLQLCAENEKCSVSACVGRGHIVFISVAANAPVCTLHPTSLGSARYQRDIMSSLMCSPLFLLYIYRQTKTGVFAIPLNIKDSIKEVNS